MRTTIVIFSFLIAAWVSPALSQDPVDPGPVRELISKLDKGDTDAVKAALPDLISRYQNDPGVLYLRARVATDGIEAAKLYQSILDNFPASEWADDALFSMYQYYYAMGLYKTADLKLQQLRKEYPQSEFLGERTPPEISPAATGNAPGTPVSAGPTDSTTPPPARTVVGDSAVRLTGREGVPAATDSGGTAEVPRGEQGSPLPYTLQVGAFSTSENAQKQKLFFQEFGYAAEITNRVRGGRSLYLVWVGSFATTADARRTLVEIQSKYNITPIVVER